MQAIGFYLVLPFIYFISLLPFPLLYLLSDLLFVILYYIIGYRRKVVIQNLKNAFPEMPEKEIVDLQKRFYIYLCDLTLETFKTLTISEKKMVKHCSMDEGSLQLIKQYYDDKKSIILVLGHLGNWEWGGNAFSLQCKQQLYVIYHALHNTYFNTLIIKMRTRFGTKLIEMKNTFKDMLSLKENISATAFIADQTPSPSNAYWTTFLNQQTPVFWGTERISKKLNYPIVYINVKRVKRGYYNVSAELLCNDPLELKEGEITEMHTKKLEENILKQPETWLWSHRRWKHKKILNA